MYSYVSDNKGLKNFNVRWILKANPTMLNAAHRARRIYGLGSLDPLFNKWAYWKGSQKRCKDDKGSLK